MELQKKFRKKLVGTAVFFLLVGAMVLATSTPVKALFIDTGKVVDMDASVVSVGSSSLVVSTAGTPNLTVNVTNKTVYTGGSSLSDIVSGDEVHIIARSRGGNLTATVIRIIGFGAEYGYGVGGNNVTVTKATVTGKTSDTFTVQTQTTTVTFKVMSNTIFTKGDFSTLAIGDQVLIQGEETDTGFIARVVVVQNSSGKHADEDNKDNHEDKNKNEVKDTHGNNDKTETTNTHGNKGGKKD